MKKFLIVVLAVIMCVAMFSACSAPAEDTSSDDAATEESTETADEDAAATDDAAANETAAEDTADGETVARIKEAGELVMLTNAQFPPYEYLGADQKPAGVDIRMAQAVADELGVELKVVDMDFDGLIPALTSGKGDMVAAGLTVTDERKESVDFSDTYADATQKIIVPEGSEIASVDDLAGKTIGVQLGTTGDIYAGDIEGATVKQYKSAIDAAMDLKNGKLDAVVVDQLPAENIVDSIEGLAICGDPFTEEQYAIAVAKGSDDLIEVINKVIEKLEADGTVDQWITECADEFVGADSSADAE